ncbi:acyltransferase [Gammaproteobacteria bacterium 45_16_T64]|nr:acyltransferase [Gammaproteobacteria bacterium 45_16_T64]
MSSFEKDVLDFTPPPLSSVNAAVKLTEAYFDPIFFGLDNISPEKPALLVGNHTIYGTLDVPLIFAEAYRERGVVIRGLADAAHYKIPGWRDLLHRSGIVVGNRHNCSRLMEAGETLLVYPGGAREVAKRRGEKYQLTWKTRTGFAYMAIKHQYPITPIASVGADDTFDIHFDAYDFKESHIGQWLLKNKRFNKIMRNGDVLMPICTGIGLSSIPRPERFYFSFGSPIDTTPFKGQEDDLEVQWHVRKLIGDALEKEIEMLQRFRESDSERSTLRRLLTRY